MVANRTREIRPYGINWLQVSGAAERPQIHQRVRQQLHAIVPRLDACKAEPQSLEPTFKGPEGTTRFFLGEESSYDLKPYAAMMRPRKL
jgi:hypothetical protein